MLLSAFEHDGASNTRSESRTFTRFAELPKEIRLLIWEEAIPGPRIVNIRQRYLNKTSDDVLNNGVTKRRGIIAKAAGNKAITLPAPRLKGLKSNCPPPSILFVCRESYTVASRYYQRVFHPAGTIPETYFDFQRDTLYLRHDTMCADSIGLEAIIDGIAGKTDRIYDRDNIARVEKLAVLVDPNGDDCLESWICYLMATFGGVKQLTIVVEHCARAGDDEGDLFLIEPINVKAVCALYESSLMQPREPMPSIGSNVNIAKGMIDMRKLKEYRSQDFKFLDYHWPIPQVDCKVAITGGYKRELDSSRRRFEERKGAETYNFYDLDRP